VCEVSGAALIEYVERDDQQAFEVVGTRLGCIEAIVTVPCTALTIAHFGVRSHFVATDGTKLSVYFIAIGALLWSATRLTVNPS
jgi:hypothetical protein